MICSCGEPMHAMEDYPYYRDGKFWTFWLCVPCDKVVRVEDAEN